MAALPESNTTRWWLDYTVSGQAHSMLMRTTTDKTAAQVSTVFSGFFDLLDTASVYQIDVTGMRKALVGSNVTLPQTYLGTTQFGAGTAIGNDFRAKTFSFTGRDDTGHKIKLFVFGAITQADGDYRLQVGTDTHIDQVVDYLNALNGFWNTINEGHPVWNAYANVGFNDHWIKRARG
jgi:hypothetical protein